MALPDKCPRCGESATTSSGTCVFCGTQVVAPSNLLVGDARNRVIGLYRSALVTFFVAGILYLAVPVLGLVAFKLVPYGFFISGTVSLIHGGLLAAKVDLVQRFTKVACIARLAMVAYTLALLLPYFVVLKVVGFLFLLIIIIDIVSLILMIRSIDDVYFNV